MNRLRVISFAAAASVLALLATPALAQDFIWIDPGTDLWFDGTNWDLGVFPPAATGNAFVNNGGTAVANVLGALGVQDLTVGLSNGVTGGGGGSGTVQANATNTAIGRDLFVGRIFGIGSGNILGTLTTSNTLTVGQDLSVGLLDGGAPGSVATGMVTTGGPLNMPGGDVNVGVSNAPGNANGVVTTGGPFNMSGVLVNIGVSNEFGNNANGSVIDMSGTGLLTAGAVSVGEADEGVGDGTGLLEVGSLNVTGTLKIGFMESNGGNADGTVTATGAVSVGSLRVGHGATFGTNLGIRTGMGQLTAEGGLTVGDRLNVGLIDGDTKNFVVATGIVTAAGVNSLGVMNSVNIGSSFGIGDADGTVIDTSGTGLLDVLFDVDVGVHSNVAGIATGLLEIGSLSIGENLQIGVADKGGNADGTVEAFGTVSAKAVKVGVSELDSTGAATGRLILHDDMVATSMTVGRNLDGSGGPAIGEVTLDNAILTVGSITLGEGSDVTFNIDGLLRGDEYGAIDAGIATLFDEPDGSMGQALFTFIPTLGTHHFDLITAPFGLGTIPLPGIVGTFSNFDVIDLDPDFKWFTEHVFENNFEIFRLTITSNVPEPVTAVFGLMGLGVLGMATRRRAA